MMRDFPHLQVYLLQPIHLEWRGSPYFLSRRQTRALLWRLAARLEPVSRASLAFLFWPDEPDARARRYLTRLLSALRAALPHPDLLQLSGETVALNPAFCTSDSDTFWRLSAQPEELATAVSLYQTPFMVDFSLPAAPEYEAWQQQAASLFEQRYLNALSTLVEQKAAVADYPAAIAYAQQSLATDTLDETMHRRLITLYIAANNRAAALRQFEACTLILERELGVSPLPETRAALQTQPMPARAPVLPVLPTLNLPLTGREQAMAQLQAAYGRLRGGGLVLVTGESGMGKSRLLHELLPHHSGPILNGGSATSGRSLPYYPLIHALRATLANTAAWSVVPPLWRSELLPLLPDLRSAFPELAEPPTSALDLAQQRLYTALVQACRALAGQSTLLFVLDDLHEADAATLGWLHFLAANWEDLPLLAIATTAATTREIASLRQALARVNRLAEVALTGLSTTAVARLLACLPTAAPPGLAARIQTVTAGNPFFVLEIMRELQETGQLTQLPTDLPLPATVREVLEARLAYLTPTARQILEAAAVLAPQLDATLLHHTAARSEAETADALDELILHGLLQHAGEHEQLPLPSGDPLPPMESSRDSSSSRHQWSLAFPHTLLQTAVYQGMSPWRQKLLHRRAARAFVSYQVVNLMVVAHHYAQAEEWQTAVTFYLDAATQARNLYAYETALTILNRAFRLLPLLLQPNTLHLALLRQRLALHRALVRISEWQSDAFELLNLAREAGDDKGMLEALESQMSLSVLQSDFAQMEKTAVPALALAVQKQDRAAEARIRQTYGWHLADALGRSREGLAQLQMACHIAQEAGETAVLYQALCNLAFVQRAEGQCAAARASAKAALALTPFQLGSPPHPAFADALRELGEANAYLARWEEARNYLRPLLDLYQTFKDPWAYGAVLHNYGLYSSNMGQHEEAIASLRQLVALSESVGLPADSDYGIWHRVGLGRVLLAAGRLDEAGALLAGLQTGRLGPGRPFLAWARTVAEYHLLRGEGAAALAALEPAVDWWRKHASLHDADVLLLLAQVLLAVEEREEAETAVAEAIAHLEPTDIARYRLRLHWTRYQVAGEPEALAAVRTELERQAAAFTDPDLRQAFLQKVPLHHQILSPAA